MRRARAGWPIGGESEQGFALITVLIVGMILIVLSSVMVARGIRQLGNTAGDARWERAMVTAEAGLETGLLALEVDPDFNTGDTLSAFATPESERGWAVAIADSKPEDDVIETPAGEVVLIKPEATTLLYAVGFSPDRSSLGRRTRVVRIGYELRQTEWELEFALLVGDDLELGGDAAIVDLNSNDAADAHANGVFDPQGSYSVEGCKTSSGTDFEAVLNCPASPIEPRPMPEIDPLVMYQFAEIVLCPDLEAYGGPAYSDDDAADPDEIPCNGNEAEVAAPGWSGRTRGGVAEWSPGDLSAVIYVHEGNIDGKIGKEQDPAAATIVVSAASEGACSGRPTGNVELGGGSFLTTHPSLLALDYDVALVAQGDIKYRGTATVQGAILAHEQIDYRGTADSVGAVVAASVCDTNGSPVSQTELSGNATIGYPGPVRTPFTDVRWQADVLSWHEL
jgi:hypothetical protein